MKKRDKNLAHYLNLPYKIEIEPIKDEEGGGFTARLSQFGTMGIVGDGDTIQEACDSLERSKHIVFKMLLDKGESIPEPEKHDQYSGRVLTRMPKELHANLVADARNNGVSLNQYMNYLLSSRASRRP